MKSMTSPIPSRIASLMFVLMVTSNIAIAESEPELEQIFTTQVYIEEPLPVLTGEPDPILTSVPTIEPTLVATPVTSEEGTGNPEVSITNLPETTDETNGSSPEVMPISAEDTSCLPPADSEFFTNMPSLDNSENSDTTSAEVITLDVPMVATNLDIHIPLAKLLSMTDSSDICAYLKYVGEDENGDMIWKLQKYMQK